MTTIQYGELTKLYGKHADVVNEAIIDFKNDVRKVLELVADSVAHIAGMQLHKRDKKNSTYPCWSFDPVKDSYELPYVSFWPDDPRIVDPGELILHIYPGLLSSKERKAKLSSIAQQPEIGPLYPKKWGDGALFAVSYESKDGVGIEQLAGRIATLLSKLHNT